MVAPAVIAGGLSLAGGLASAFGANKASKRAYKQFQEQLAYTRQRDAQNDAFSQQIFAMVPGLMDRTYAQEDYYRSVNDQRSQAALELMDYLRGWDSTNYQNASQDRSYVLDLQSRRDQIAAESRRYDLERIARNQNLSQQERAWAIQQLERAQGIATQERADESADIAAFNQTRSNEYADRYARLMQDRTRAAQERQYEQDKQDRILAQTASMRDQVNNVLRRFGNLDAPELLGAADIDAEAAKRAETYTAAVQAMVDRVTSKNEAALIKRGMSTGGDSNESRAEIMSRMAPEFMKALSQAETEAIQMVEGKNKQALDRFAALRQARETSLSEAQLSAGAGLDIEAGLGAIQSGVLDRDLGSAAEYIRRAVSQNVQSPVSIGSGVYDSLSPGAGYSDYMGVPSRQTQGSTASGMYDVVNLPSYDWGGLINASIGARGGNGSEALDVLNQQAQAAGAAAGYAGNRLGNTIDGLLGAGLDWFSNRNSGIRMPSTSSVYDFLGGGGIAARPSIFNDSTFKAAGTGW